MTRLGQAAEIARALPDTNGDGQLVLMAQDPFMLRFLGLRSVMIPNEDRETVLYVADRYGVDYLLMPPDREALDPIFSGADADTRFTLAARVPGTDYALYGLDLSSVAEGVSMPSNQSVSVGRR
jgi:hypothetical protein